MIQNRKNTTKVVDTWRDFLGSKNINPRRRLNESTARDRNEHFEALFASLVECDWDEDRIDMLIDVLEKCNITDDELEIIAYGSRTYDDSESMSDEARHFQQERFIEREPLEADDDLGM